MKVISLQVLRNVLLLAYGEGVQVCLQPGVDPEKLTDDGDDVPEGKRKTGDQKRASLWVCDLFADPPKMATRGDGKFFDVVMDNSLGWWQPLLVDEPTKPVGEPVGTVRAQVAFHEGGLYIKVTMVKRPAARGAALLEVDGRASASNDPSLGTSDTEIGTLVYSNSARIGRGPVRVTFVEVKADQMGPLESWLPLEEYVRNGTDPMGMTAAVRAALELGLQIKSPMGGVQG